MRNNSNWSVVFHHIINCFCSNSIASKDQGDLPATANVPPSSEEAPSSPEQVRPRRSRFHQRDEEERQLVQQQGRSRRNVPTQIPPTKISLAITEGLQDVFISISTLWVPECVVDKRMNVALGCYQYLMKFKGWSMVCNAWYNPKDILDCTMVQKFEERRGKQVKEKRHVAAWFPYGENFVVRWKQHPFFIVPYGSGQLNKFCVVGVNKSGKALKCKHAHHPDHPQHQVHVQLVEKELSKQKLKLWKKKIVPIDFVEPASEVEPESEQAIVKKPMSRTPIHLISTAELQAARLKLLDGSANIPQEFKPRTHPSFCLCTTEVEGEGGVAEVCKTRYKSAPEPYSKATTLWLPHGPPITGHRAYIWKCMNNNPACNVNYDGHEDGIFNYSNATMVSHAILFEFMFGLISGYVDQFKLIQIANT